jgi:hypothetical protein
MMIFVVAVLPVFLVRASVRRWRVHRRPLSVVVRGWRRAAACACVCACVV